MRYQKIAKGNTMSNSTENTSDNNEFYVNTPDCDELSCDNANNTDDFFGGTTGLSDTSIYKFYRLLLPETDNPESYSITISSLENLSYEYIKNNFINNKNQSHPFTLLKDGDIISIDNTYCTIYSKAGDDHYPMFLCPTSFLNESDKNKYIDFVKFSEKKTFRNIFNNKHNMLEWHTIKDAPFINNKNNDIVIYVNGIQNNQRDVISSLKLLRDGTSKNVMAIYNATAIVNEKKSSFNSLESTAKDLFQCLEDRDLQTRVNENKATDTLIQILSFLEPLKNIQTIYLVAHSQGSLIARNAIWEIQNLKLFSKLVVLTAGRAVGGKTLNDRHWKVGPAYLHIQDVRDPVSNLLAGGETISYKIGSGVFGFDTTYQNVFDKRMYKVKRKESKKIFQSHHWHELLFIGERKGVIGKTIKYDESEERNIQNIISFLYDDKYKVDLSKLKYAMYDFALHSDYHTFSLSYINIVSKIIKDNYKAFCSARLKMHAFVFEKRTMRKISGEPATFIISENDITGITQLIESLTGPERHSDNKVLYIRMLGYVDIFSQLEIQKNIVNEADHSANSTIGSLNKLISVINDNVSREYASNTFIRWIRTILYDDLIGNNDISIKNDDVSKILNIFYQIKSKNVRTSILNSFHPNEWYELFKRSDTENKKELVDLMEDNSNNPHRKYSTESVLKNVIQKILDEKNISSDETNTILSIFNCIDSYRVNKYLIESIDANRGWSLLDDSSQDYGEKFGDMIKTKKLGDAKIVAFNKYIKSVFNNIVTSAINNDNADKILDLIIASKSNVLVQQVMSFNYNLNDSGADKRKIKIVRSLYF